jgi:hypothetical protein
MQGSLPITSQTQSGLTVRVIQTHRLNALFIYFERNQIPTHPASQFGLQTFPARAIHHMTMRPRVEGNYEQETGTYMSLHTADYTSS